MMKKQFHVSIMWFLFCSPACLSSNIDIVNDLKLSSNHSSHFWKRGKGFEIDLNFLPPEEESEGLSNQPHSQNTNKVVEPTLISTKKRKKSTKAFSEVERKHRKASYEKNRRRERREIWNEAKKDPTKLTPELQKAMDKHIQSQRIRQKRYYKSLSKKFKDENFASEAQSHTWHHMRQTPEWRAESNENEAKYQRRLQISREYKKQKREDARMKKDSIQKRDLFNDELALEDYPFDKRANGLDIDLNSSPPKEEEEDKSHNQKDGEHTSTGQRQHITSFPNRRVGRPKVFTDAERKERKRIYALERRKKTSKIWKEAQSDAKKMTPEIQKAIDKHHQAQRKRQKRYHAKLDKLVEANQPLTQKQFLVYHRKHKTAEWRKLSPSNEARYQLHKERERDRKREMKRTLKAKKDGQDNSAIQRDGLNEDLDLNKTLSDDSNFQKRGISSDVSPNSAHVAHTQLDPDSHPTNSQNNQEVNGSIKPKRTRKTAVEKKQARNEVVRRYRAKRKNLWDEALSDPTKSTPKIESEMKRFYESRRKRVKRYYQSVKAKVENNKELSPAQFKLYHLWRRTPTWRAASNENQAAYEQHKSDNKKRRRKDRESKQEDGHQHSPEPPLHKRAIDTDIDLNKSPPNEDDDSQAPVKFHSRKKKQLSVEEKRERSKIYQRLHRLRRKGILVKPSKEEAILKRKERKREYNRMIYHDRMKKVKSGQTLTPKEVKYVNVKRKTLAWRKENPEIYSQYLQQKKEKARLERAAKNSKNYKSDEDIHFQKRAFDLGIDLNHSPPREEEDEPAKEDAPEKATSKSRKRKLISLEEKRNSATLRKRLSRKRYKEAQEEHFKLTGKILRPSEEQMERRRESDRKRYKIKMGKARSGQRLTLAEEVYVNRKIRSAKYRRENKEEYVRYLKQKSVHMKEKRKIDRQKKKVMKDEKQLRKRALDPEIDLNLPPPNVDDDEVNKVVLMESTKSKKNRKKNISPESKKRYATRKRLERHRREERWKEALKNPALMTPELNDSMNRYIEFNRIRSNKYFHAKMEKAQSGQTLTPKEERFLNRANKTNKWKTEYPEEHARYLKQVRDRRKQKLINESKQSLPKGSKLQKRALEPDIDLNDPAPETEVTHKPTVKKNEKKTLLTPEERIKRTRASKRAYKKRVTIKRKEALDNSSNISPTLRASILRSMELDRKRNSEYYHKKAQKEREGQELTPKMLRKIEITNKRLKYKTENPKEWEDRLRQLRERRKLARKINKHDQLHMQKRALDPEIDLNKSPPNDEDDVHGAEVINSSKGKMTEKEKIRKRLERQRREKRWKEALNDPSKMNPSIRNSIDKHKLGKSIRNKRSYQKLVQKVKSGQKVTQSQQNWYDRVHKTAKWRKENPEEYARFLQYCKDRRRRRKKVEKREIASNVRIQKRGLDIDLNELPPSEEEQAVNPVTTSQIPTKQQRKKKVLTPEQRKQKSFTSSECRRRRKARVREAMKDPAKVTPEVQAMFDKFVQANRKSAKRSYDKLRQKVKEGQTLTPIQHKRFHRLFRTKEWREDPANKEKYARMLEVDRKRKRKDNTKSKNVQKDAKLHKRGLEKDIDLNMPPPPGSESLEDHSLNAVHSTKTDRKKLSPKEKRERNLASSRDYKRRQRELWNEAIIDPTKMTEKLRKYIENSRIKSHNYAKRQHKKLKMSIKHKEPLTIGQVRRIHSVNRSKEWREADPKNQKKYERYLQKKREKYHNKKNKDTENVENMTEDGNLNKRGLDPNIDLNQLPPEHPDAANEDVLNRHATLTILLYDTNKKKDKEAITPEMRKKNTASVMASRRRFREKWREALKDPSKMTPKLQASINKYKASQRKASKKRYDILKQKEKNKEHLTEADRRRLSATARTIEWRNATPENKRKYQEHLKRNKENKRRRREEAKDPSKKG